MLICQRPVSIARLRPRTHPYQIRVTFRLACSSDSEYLFRGRLGLIASTPGGAHPSIDAATGGVAPRFPRNRATEIGFAISVLPAAAPVESAGLGAVREAFLPAAAAPNWSGGRWHQPYSKSCHRPQPRAVGGLVRSDQPAAGSPAIPEPVGLGATGHVFVAGAGAGLIRRSPQATPATSPSPATPITTSSRPPTPSPTAARTSLPPQSKEGAGSPARKTTDARPPPPRHSRGARSHTGPNQPPPAAGGPSNCYDNAMVESFWGKLKTEMVHHERFATKARAHAAAFEYIEMFYNRKRLHAALDYVSPEAFEARRVG